MALFVNFLPLGVFPEVFPSFLGGFTAGEGDEVDELPAFAVLLVERGPEADQLGAVLLQEAQVWSRNRLCRSSSFPSLGW